jgi:N6-adenosine-specific RNA methylase IME4
MTKKPSFKELAAEFIQHQPEPQPSLPASFTEDLVDPIDSSLLDSYRINTKDALTALQEDLSAGMDPNAYNGDKITPIHFAALHGYFNCVEPLARAGANLNARDSNRDTALHIAAEYSDNKMIAALLEWKAQVNLLNDAGISPLIQTMTQGNVEGVKILLGAKAKVARTQYEDTPDPQQQECIDLINAAMGGVFIESVKAKKKPKIKKFVIKGTPAQQLKLIETVDTKLVAEVKSKDLDLEDAKRFAEFKKEAEHLGKGYYTKARKSAKKHPHLKVRDVINSTRGEALAEINKTLTIPSGKLYRVLYCDPPWSYGGTRPGVSSPNDKYMTSTTDEICATVLRDTNGKSYPVKEVMAPNSVLFMWTTSPHLEQSFRVIAAFGFTYKSSFIWHKVKHNMGFYNSVRHEILLVATRGSATPDNVILRPGEDPVEKQLYPSVYPSPHIEAEKYDMEPMKYGEDSVYEEARGEHSKKPDYYYELIERLYPYGEKLEMYCRSPRPGWDFWGNQAETVQTAPPVAKPKPETKGKS